MIWKGKYVCKVYDVSVCGLLGWKIYKKGKVDILKNILVFINVLMFEDILNLLEM